MSRSLMFIVVLALIALVLGSPAPGNGNTSPDWSCGGKKGYVCPGSMCCSRFSWCGTGKDYCDSGCQSKFGTCGSSQPPSSPGGSGKKVSPNGTCGGRKGYTCKGSYSGDCCSEFSYCGDSAAYCGKGCQSDFGTCKSSVKTSTKKSSTKPVTKASTSKPTTKPSTKTTKATTKISTKKSSTKPVTKSSTKSSVKSSTKSYTKSNTKSSTKSSTYAPSVTSVTSSEPLASSTTSETSFSVSVEESSTESSSTISETASSSTVVGSSTASETSSAESSSTVSETESSSTAVESSTATEASSTSSDISITSSETSSTASSTPSAPCGPNLLTNPGFEQGSDDWTLFLQGAGAGAIQQNTGGEGIPLLEGSHFVSVEVYGEPIVYALQQTTGITAGSFVSCSGWVYYDGDGNGNVASLYVEALVNGNLCAQHTYYAGGWNKLESSIPVIVDSDNPQIIFRIYVQNMQGSTLKIGMDQFSIRYGKNAVEQLPPCGEVPPGPGVSSSATSSATSTAPQSSSTESSVTSSTISESSTSSESSSSVSSTASETSSSSTESSSSVTTFETSVTASSTVSSATASSTAACKPNLLVNGDFNTGALEPFGVSVGNGGGGTEIGVVTTGNIPTKDGTPFFQLTSTFSPQVYFFQAIPNIPSGSSLRCAFDIYSPAGDSFDAVFNANFVINGQSCASVGGVWVDPWGTFSNFAVSTVNNDPVNIELTLTLNNPNNDVLYFGLDNLYVWIDSAETAELPFCPPSPSTPTVDQPVSSSSTSSAAASSPAPPFDPHPCQCTEAVDPAVGVNCNGNADHGKCYYGLVVRCDSTWTQPAYNAGYYGVGQCVNDCANDPSCPAVTHSNGFCLQYIYAFNPTQTTDVPEDNNLIGFIKPGMC